MKIAASVALTLSLLIVACSPPSASPAAPRQQSAVSSSPAKATRVVMATFRELDFLPYSAVPGTYELRNAVNPGLAVFDDRGALRPLLAEAAPSLENGFWKVSADGRMETTWTLKQGALWHDGEMITADDLAFTIQVGRDRATGIFGLPAYASMDEVSVMDPRTTRVTWKQPFIDADQLFTIWAAWPMPKHVLEQAYTDDPLALGQSPFWTVDYVGSGPYKLREYAAGSRIILDAFDKYLLGKPKVDQIEVPYIPDPSTVLSNILAGSVDMTVGIGLPVDSVVEIRDRWPDGRFTFEFSDQRWFRLDPQFIDATPAVVTDLRFRRAMLYAIDRQEMADSLQAGIAPVAHTFMAPNQPEYAGIEGRVMKYEHDPARATRLLEELGYQRGADGMIHDPTGKFLEVEIAGANVAVTKPMLAVAKYWQKVGVGSNTFVVPPLRATDWPWRATFSTFALFTGTHDLPGLPALMSTQARTAQNNYEVSGLPNWPRYQNAELDDLVTRFFRTIPKAERIEVLTRINQHVFENLSTIPLYYFPTPYAVANRVANVPVDRGARASLTWNAEQWEVRS